MDDFDLIHERLVALCALIDDVKTAEAWWPDNRTPFTAEELPAIIVNPAPAGNNTITSGSEYSSGQDWFLNVFMARFPADYKLRDRETWELARPFMRIVPVFFNQRRSLELNDGGVVMRITLPSLYSLTPSTLDRALYASAGFRMTTFSLYGG